MDLEDLLPKRADDPLTLLIRQDLDRFSVDELGARIQILEAEISRTKAKRDGASRFRNEADALFKK
jgi:uncharacterized small protein (DUF1192 family)